MLCGYPLLISAYVYGFVEAGTREASFMSAIVAAGVAHAVIKATKEKEALEAGSGVDVATI